MFICSSVVATPKDALLNSSEIFLGSGGGQKLSLPHRSFKYMWWKQNSRRRAFDGKIIEHCLSTPALRNQTPPLFQRRSGKVFQYIALGFRNMFFGKTQCVKQTQNLAPLQLFRIALSHQLPYKALGKPPWLWHVHRCLHWLWRIRAFCQKPSRFQHKCIHRQKKRLRCNRPLCWSSAISCIENYPRDNRGTNPNPVPGLLIMWGTGWWSPYTGV